tara:strand:+ start:55 stop:483 length:429 start_codon:yes stop_codon:yes gene_type:complete
MKSYEDKFYLKKKVSYEDKKNPEKKFILNIKLIHQISNAINISLSILIITLFFLSFDSQRKWSKTYKILSKTKTMNNNLIDYISKTEEFYISEIESQNIFKKTKPKDLIYLEKVVDKKQSFFKKNFKIFAKGLFDSKYHKGY